MRRILVPAAGGVWPLVWLLGMMGSGIAQEGQPSEVQLRQVDVGAASVPTFVQETGALDQARQGIYAPVGANAYEIDRTTIEALPAGNNTPLDKVLLQLPGVSQDSAASGDLHVRNEHANVQYRINGILLPDGVSGFSQFLDTSFVGTLALLDGVLPAQYGLHTAAVIDITTPSQFAQSSSISMYGGSHATAMPSFTTAGSFGQTQYFFAGRLLSDNVGIENPTSNSDAIHDQTRQGKFFGYVSTLLPNDLRLSVITGTSVNSFQIPNSPGQAPGFTAFGTGTFDSAAVNENQVERSFYNVVALQKSFGPLDTQLSVYSRYSFLHFLPDPVGDLVFNGVASDVSRESLLNGIQSDSAYHLGPHTIRFGFNVSAEKTTAANNDVVQPADATGAQIADAPFAIPSSSSELGWLGSVYLQDEWKINNQWTVNGGLRFDQMAEYVTTNQLSPRLAVVYKPFAATTFHAGFARYFTPPEQALAAPVNVAAYNSTTAQAEVMAADPVRPERSDVFDAGVMQKLNDNLDAGVDAYYKIARNLLDDGQFGQALVLTAFNYARAYNTGVEFTGKYHIENLTAYANVAWGRQRATQVSSNQYLFGADEIAYISQNYIYTDHDQTWTGSGGVSYLFKGPDLGFLDGTRASVDLIYGSGLRDGFANTGTVAPYTQVNLGLAHDFAMPKDSGLGPLTLRFDVVNLLDNVYEIRDGSGIGVFAPQYGPRRGFFGGLTQRF